VQAFREALAQGGPSVSLHGHRLAADAASRAAGGQGIATQTWGLADKVVAVERAVLSAGADAVERVVEVHPECSFAVLADELGWPRPRYAKRSAVGASRRASLLEAGLGLDVRACLDDPALAAARLPARIVA
jgi:predicted RNase H-like nuclease